MRWFLRSKIHNATVTDARPTVAGGTAERWTPVAHLTDEFGGSRLDPAKWHPNNPRWKGRKPGFFHTGNVAVRRGCLHITMKAEDLPDLPKGYHTFTCGAVKSTKKVRYGFFEARCRAMDSRGSSAFWFYDNTKTIWTEIDVFEIGAASPGFEKKYNMNVHVFKTPTEKEHWSSHGLWIAPKNLADDYHVYALEWDQQRIRWYFDGVLVRWVENTHWHQPLTLNFDSETMPDWFGLPRDEDLPSTYKIEYVRTWKKKGTPSDTNEATR